jgi:hypothetical protein
MKTRIVLSLFCAGILTAACGAAPSESLGSASEELGQGTDNRPADAGHGPASGHGNGRGDAGNQGHGDGDGNGRAECKPTDGGPSPCARGLEDNLPRGALGPHDH